MSKTTDFKGFLARYPKVYADHVKRRLGEITPLEVKQLKTVYDWCRYLKPWLQRLALHYRRVRGQGYFFTRGACNEGLSVLWIRPMYLAPHRLYSDEAFMVVFQNIPLLIFFDDPLYPPPPRRLLVTRCCEFCGSHCHTQREYLCPGCRSICYCDGECARRDEANHEHTGECTRYRKRAAINGKIKRFK